jgi:crotonobetainyl-CoA:carnitine CoA-transferase CaiB-like acyl-CoA transferase
LTTHHSVSAGPLTGVRVLDMTSIGMGPMATQLLGDMGADVVKVETDGGDVFRHVTPQRHAAMSHAYLNLNRNKRSAILDAKTPEGRDAILRLAEGSDVFVSNIRPDALARLGLDAAALLQRQPRLIHCGCYGYSERGPYGGRASLDDVIQAACGLAWFQGIGAEQPRYVNGAVVDKVCGLYIANAITMALYAREKTGRGQSIEVPMFETMVAFTLVEHLAGLSFIPAEGPPGYSRILNPWRRPYRSRDGHIAVVPYTDGQWRRFFRCAGRADLADDPRFATAPARADVYPELYRIVEDCIAARTNAEWTALLRDQDIPYAPVNSTEDLIADPHLAAIGFWHELDHPTEGRLRMPGIPIRFSDTPGSIRRHAPSLGEHTKDILREIGMKDRPA